MRLSELDSFRQPSRKPWLLLVVLLVAGTLVYWKRSGRRLFPERPPKPPAGEVEAPVAADGASEPSPPAARLEPIRPLDPAPPPTPSRVEPPQNVQATLAKGRAAESGGQLLDARRCYLAVLAGGVDARARAEVERRLGKVNMELLLTPRVMPDKKEYEVRRGDSLAVIASRFGTTADLIQVANRLPDPDKIRQGQRLQVFTGEFHLVASRRRNDLVVTMNGGFFKRYRVGTGKEGKTPLGTFKVVEKQKEPTWWPQGREVPFGHPDNILGTRWMSIRATGNTPDVQGYGIHGTWDDASIGKSESAGCIRMHNKDVEELYVYVPRGTAVTIVD